MGRTRDRLRAVGVTAGQSSVRHCTLSIAGLACALALTTVGCTIGRFYSGAPLRADPSALVEGRSTKIDVLRLFGPPAQITHQTTGDAFVYLYRKENYSSFHLQDPITGINWFTYTRELEDRDTLVVLFDFNGVVRAVAVDRHVHEMPTL
jgi:outer membrane protein assembly factor BamE (lipoprotein component of BamABCDE complex)